MVNKNELFKNKVKLITNNLKKKMNDTINTEKKSETRVKISYNDLVREVLGKDSTNMKKGNNQTFKNVFSANKTNFLKPMMNYQKGAKK